MLQIGMGGIKFCKTGDNHDIVINIENSAFSICFESQKIPKVKNHPKSAQRKTGD